jgi:PAS domain-containing protein
VLIATDRQVSDYRRDEAKSDALRWQLWRSSSPAWHCSPIPHCACCDYADPCGARRTGRTGILGAALRHAMAENRLILDTTDDGMFGVDQAGRIRFINLPLPNCSGRGRAPGWAGPPPGHAGR